jgi:chromosomal replication initiator protein
MATQPGMESTLRAAVAERLGESRFGLWFGEGVRLGVAEDSDSLEVAVPNSFFRDWIQGHFAGNLVDAAREVTGRSLRLDFRIDGEAPPPLGHVVEGPPPDANDRPLAPPPPVSIPKASPPVDRPRSQAPAPAPSPTPTRPARRLDDFVTGPGNRLAHSAALELVQTLAGSFNPLVIQGSVGLGKTHLLEGIGAALRARHPGMKVIHLTAEGFTNGFLDAMRHGALTAFRARYRGAGALLVDDIHFLAAKKATQDEFLHTFNALVADGSPIVLTSDQHPRQIARLTDELATRFLGGMVVKLDVPDPATRRSILKAKAAARGVIVPEAVLAYVADHLRASVRELEGALHSLIAHATMTGKRLDLALAKTALRDTIRHTARAVALKDVEKAVCQLFQIEPEALKADNRARAVAYPRMLGMYLARKHTGAAYSEIGRFFGGRNHSTVISAEKKVIGWIKDEARNGLLAGFETMSDILNTLERTLGA